MATIITHPKGSSLFDVGADILVCPVNTVGVMGKGLALEFKKRYPFLFNLYKAICDNKKQMESIRKYGRGHLVPVSSDPSIPTTAILAFTKEHWRDASRIEWVEAIAGYIAQILATDDGMKHLYGGKPSIAIPALGCGLGELSWAEVEPIILKAVESLPDTVTVHLFPPH